jgi:hypothetical protein
VKLSEVRIAVESIFNHVQVGAKLIGGDLDAAYNALGERAKQPRLWSQLWKQQSMIL